MKRINLLTIRRLKKSKSFGRESRVLVNTRDTLIQCHLDMPGGGVGLHYHRDADDIVYIIKGSAEARVGDSVFGVKEGDIYFVPRKTPHSLINKGRRPVIVLDILTPKPRGKIAYPVKERG